MLTKKALKILAIILLVFFWVSGGKADFIDISNPYEGIYNFFGTDRNGKEFTYNIQFDLWQDLTSGLYQYKYQLNNLSDESGAGFQILAINHDAPVINMGSDPGSYQPLATSDNGTTASFLWWPSVPSGGTTTWFWLTSYGPPALQESIGDGVNASASGMLPAPAPEPSTFITLILGLLLMGLWFSKGSARIS